jgi:oligopeptide/dipeptide ABC transporter ATP-binding protein
MSLLEVRGLRTHLPVLDGTARAVDGVDLTIGPGETVGVVGESGSGKTVLALSILGLLPQDQGEILPGSSIRFRGEELVGVKKERLRKIRGAEIAMVFQEPMTSLNPVFAVGSQIREAVELHRGLKGPAAVGETVRLMSEVGIPDPEARMNDYPHQFSGGMRQRVMIAMALAGEPSLLIADEPTTALDVTIESQIIGLLVDLQTRLDMALLFISHDLGVVSRVCQRLVILYGGRVVEAGATNEILDAPKHPYTRGLMNSRLAVHDRRSGLRPIAGEVPEATNWPGGCRFHPRCPEVHAPCGTDEPLLAFPAEDGTREVRCWLFHGKVGGS